MSSYQEIAALLMTRLYNDSDATPCGPGLAYTQFEPQIKEAAKELNKLPFINPSQFFHPHIAVVFDFTHQFTAPFTTSLGVKSERPVSRETLFRVGAELTRFFDYYFEYVLSYGIRDDKSKVHGTFDKSTQSWIRSLVDWNTPDENSINLFLNYILNFFLMGFTTDQSVNNVGTATISFANNYNFRNGQKIRMLVDQTFGILNQLFAPMVPCMIWATGRLYPDWYFPAFDGYVSSPDGSTTAGFSELAVVCKDTLELARISTEMINPAIMQTGEITKQTIINIFQQPLYGQDHMAIVDALFNGGALLFNPENRKFEVGTPEKMALNFAALDDFDKYYDTNPGLQPATLLGQGPIKKTDWKLKTALDMCSHKRKRGLSLWGNSITPYRVLANANPEEFTGEFSSRLEILQNIATLVYYNFYVDGFGTIHYHPMRLMNDYLSNEFIYTPNTILAAEPSSGQVTRNQITRFPTAWPGSQVIGDGETTSANSRINVDELTTFLRITGQDPYVQDTVWREAVNFGYAIDTHYMARFGYRRKSLNNQLLSYNPTIAARNGRQITLLDLAAYSLLQYMNAELYTTSRTMIFRPELQIAAPVFFPDDGEVFYCQSKSHSVRINGEATTTISGNFGRRLVEAPPDLMSFILTNERWYKNPNAIPKSGLPATATAAEVQQYLNTVFGLNSLPVAQWLEDVEKQRGMYDNFEKVKSEKLANTIAEENF